MDYLANVPFTGNLVSGNCSAGSTNTFLSTVTTAPVIRGKFGTGMAAQSNTSIVPTTDANTGLAFPAILPNFCAAVVFGNNAAGTLVAVQGAQIATLTGVTTTVGGFLRAPQFPALPDDFCPIAYTIVRVAPSGGTGFVLGTTQWTASSMSCTTFKNICTLPDRPQIA